jgi:hypothetical protein
VSVVISPEVKSAFPNIRLCSALIRGLHIDEHNSSLDLEVRRVEEDFRRRLSLDALKITVMLGLIGISIGVLA